MPVAKKKAKQAAAPAVQHDSGDASRDKAPLGAHVSVAGGTWNAAARAAEINATGIQIFTKQANRWAEREVTDEEAAKFREAIAGTKVRWICAHDSYLINLASPEPALRARSIESFIAELRRCNALGLDAVVSHPGNFIDDREAGIERNATAIATALDQVAPGTRLLMELTAGQGTVIGSTFQEMALLLEMIGSSYEDRIGVCLDTAHIWAAGYDLINNYDAVIDEFDSVIGLSRLYCLHLNDSKAQCGSHLDRHDLIGEGTIGESAFRRIMTDQRLAHIPGILETPKGDDAALNDSTMLRRLRSYRDY